jgi:hypothetical protein
VIENDDELQPSLRGYVRLDRVNYDLTGLENIEKPMPLEDEEQRDNENYKEIDTTQKESEWLAGVFDEQVAIVLQDALQLEYLNLSGCENLGDHVLETIAAAKCKQQYKSVKARPMIGLWMSLLRNMTPAGINKLIRAEKKLQLERKLTHLDLGFQVLMTDEVIKQIAEYWNTSLVSVRLNSIYELSDLTVEHLANNCPNLRLLHLVRCWRINNVSLRLLAVKCKELVYISVSFLSRTTEDGIRYLIRLCPKLIWLDITGCSINSLFKQMILEGWKQDRIQNHLPPVYIQDGSMNLL